MSQLSHAQFPLRRHPNLLVDHRRSRSAAVAEPRGANGEAVTGSGGRLHFGMVAGIKSERWPTSNRNPRPDCLGIRTLVSEALQWREAFKDEAEAGDGGPSAPHHVSTALEARYNELAKAEGPARADTLATIAT